MQKRLAACCVVLWSVSTALAADPFSEYVRSSKPLTPAEQSRTFHLPPGFEIKLITSEPNIGKPMNLAFDSRGRLWVTYSNLYPQPAKTPADKKDCIKVIELAEDGSAKSITTFAEGLDIPIGLYPITDGSSVIAYDINNIRKFTDSDGDGKSDKVELLYSGFGFEDTHGMASNFRRGFDGWLYGTHGFASSSHVKDLSGKVTDLKSGHTYRMRMDGSHFELFTIGQINPFGMSMDPLGNIYTSDSHSKPIYQLLRGGRYEAFDRSTDDGLGLAPMMMNHLHNSTAIAGSCFYAATQFPEEFRGNVFVGNVMTGRINRDKLEYHGSTPRAIEQADFLSTDDPWFRPVNTLLGPDGAIYIADFYNRIIGHYEVKLDDPRRDYERGRLWRISYKRPTVAKFDISRSGATELIAKLNDPNILVRQLATNELSDRVGTSAVKPLLAIVEKGTPLQKIHGGWTLYRLRALPSLALARLAEDQDASVRVHAMRILSETIPWTSEQRALALKALTDGALIERCAADALGQHPDLSNIRPLLAALKDADRADTHLVHVLRMALRNQLKTGTNEQLAALKLTSDEVISLADVAIAVDTPVAAQFLLDHLNELALDRAKLTRYLRHAVRYAESSNVEPLSQLMQSKFADSLDVQLELFQSIRQGLEQRGQQLPPAAQEWGVKLVTTILQGTKEVGWTSAPVDRGAAVVTPWGYEQRNCTDGKRVELLSSLPGGEQVMSVLKSQPFKVPGKMSFFLAGHDSPPNVPAPGKNFVRLRLSTDDKTIADAKPPRNDTAHKIEWDLQNYVGQQAYLEITDGDAGTGFAWLAIGRVEPKSIKLPQPSPIAVQQRLQFAANTAAQTKLIDAALPLRSVLADGSMDSNTRVAAATALVAVNANSTAEAMSKIVVDPSEAMVFRKRIAEVMGTLPAARDAVVASFKTAPAELQTALGQALTTDKSGSEALLVAVQAGKAPPRLLLSKLIHDRLIASGAADAPKRIKELTKGVAAPKEEVDKLIAQRRAAFASAAPDSLDTTAGEQVFTKNCAACHQIDGKGAVVGPQLAGLSKRGVDRLIEDVLDPDRNVDPAFHYSNIFLKDGKVVTGLQKREEGEVLVFVDSQGKELPIKKSEISRRFESPGSLMVSNFSEIISVSDFNNLLAYLLTK